jgi:hypothetical protein
MLTNFIKNNLVIPKLYKENLYKKDGELNMLFDVYYYIPSNFVNTGDLS